MYKDQNHGLYLNGTHDLLSRQKMSKLSTFYNFHIYVLVDKYTMKILKEIEFVNSHSLENIVK